MIQIIPKLFVGSDEDDEKARENDWSILRCCKDGKYGHRAMLGYTSMGAPKDKNYYFIRKGNRMALNLIDSDNPHMIPEQAINAGLQFVKEEYDAGKTILIHCNHGRSRGPTTALMFLRMIGEMPGNFHTSESKFKTLYPNFSPNHGMEQFARFNWRNLLNGEVKNVDQ